MRVKNVIISLKLPKKYDILIQATVLLLIAFGTLMICSTTVGKTAQDTMALPKAMLKQGVFICVSYCLMMFFANNFSLSKFRKHYLIVGAVILIALFSTRFFTEVYGSKAWIRIPLPGMEVTLQPSEFAKVYLIVLSVCLWKWQDTDVWIFGAL
nr:FtsW/RodA/SpoVE family cell cycle protein [Amedibacillus dolichus]